MRHCHWNSLDGCQSMWDRGTLAGCCRNCVLLRRTEFQSVNVVYALGGSFVGACHSLFRACTANAVIFATARGAILESCESLGLNYV